MPSAAQLDILVLGGGIAGLWTLDRLARAGYAVALVEREALAAGQTGIAQGMLHAGAKYALAASDKHASLDTLAACAPRWRACLAGHDAPDLADVRVMSEHTHLACSGHLAGARMRRRGAAAAHAPPAALQGFAGRVYQVADPVVDVQSLMQSLARRWQQHLIAAGRHEPALEPRPDGGCRLRLRHGERETSLEAAAVVLAAGADNSALARQLDLPGVSARRLPLHQVLVHHPDAPPLWVHAFTSLGVDRPDLTISSHPDGHDGWIWYLGGALATQGAGRPRDEQLAAARTALARLTPTLDLRLARLDTLRAERVEPADARGGRRLQPWVERHGNVFVCWPVKMALAPALGDEVYAAVAATDITPSGADAALPRVASLPAPAPARALRARTS